MAFWKFTGTSAYNFNQLSLVARPGYVYDFGASTPPSYPAVKEGSQPLPSFPWTSDPGPASDGPVDQQSDLSKDYVALGVPTYQSKSRTKTWSPVACGYNLESPTLSTIRSTVRQARAGASKVLLCAGDSKTYGNGVLAAPGISKLSYPAQMRDLFNGQQGFIAANLGDTQWSANSGWTAPVSTQQNYLTSTTAASITLTTTEAFTGLKIAAYLPSGGPCTFTVTVDGGAGTPVTLTTSPGNFHYLTAVTGLANTSHTVVITNDIGARLYGVGLTYATSGLQVFNMGRSSSDAQDWLPVNFSTLYDNAFTGKIFPQPDAAILNIGTNTNSGSTTPAMIGTLASDITARGIPLLLCGYGGIDYNTNQIANLQALYDAADTYDLPLIDLHSVYGGYAQANAAGLMFDAVHENSRGNQLAATAIARVLAPV